VKAFGTILIFLGVLILLFIFGPVLRQELGYQFDQMRGVKYSLDARPEFPGPGVMRIVPVEDEFGIVIEKINLNAEVFPNIDAGNPDDFLPVLKQGVAHALGSKFPNQEGNVFLFGHSTDAFYNVGRYNALFFLIGKLEEGDKVSLYYQETRYKYEVIDKVVVAPEGIKPYLDQIKDKKTLTLQTCYPPGTSLKRLLVIARQLES